MDNFECGGFFFSSNFDSGNLMTVQLVQLMKSNEGKDKPTNKLNEVHCDAEFNLWTRPDCAGTVYENSNRTWFYFGIKGGDPNKVVKLNIMNLNKQAKLFSQGMHPVIKIGDNGIWERIKDKPMYSLLNESFFVSFLHKTGDIPKDLTVYYAFTFPFTYSELQKQLENFDRKFLKPLDEIKNIINTLAGSEENEKDHHESDTTEETIDNLNLNKLINNYDDELRTYQSIEQTEDETLLEPPVQLLKSIQNEAHCLLEPDKKDTAGDENTSESMQQITKLVNNVTIELAEQLPLEMLCTPTFAYARSYKSKTPEPKEVAPKVVPADPFIELVCSPGFVYANSNSQTKQITEKIITVTKKNENVIPKAESPPNALFTSKIAVATTRKSQKTNKIDGKERKLKRNMDPLDSEIYYHRELLIRSYEGLRIDLLTITSFHGIQHEREQIIEHLFPETVNTPRCHTFKDKKVIFISSRVHPGETPASFVLNGFLNLLLDKKNTIAITLRKMYVFKIVPFLNPDGVYNGLYRSDTLGHNLNRFYLCPDLQTQPSIYAARELVKFYHTGTAKTELTSELEDVLIDSRESESPEVELPLKEHLPMLIEDQFNVIEFKEKLDNDEKSNYNSASESSSVEDISSKANETSPDTIEDLFVTTTTTSVETAIITNAQPAPLTIFTDQLIPEIKPIVQEKPKTLFVRSSSGIRLNRKISLKNATNLFRSSTSHIPISTNSKLKEFSITSPVLSTTVTNTTTTSVKRSNLRKEGSVKGKNSQLHLNNRAHRNDIQAYTGKTVNISSDFMAPNAENGERKMIDDEKSNLFLYLDLHGHASKKGVFMYGNHLPNSLESVECMLLPRLMSMNCHHFHFDACNFSERNMYFKGKRDGLSKEGSGRVAIYKATGLIKSYTLECNYNTGKCVNVLPPRGKETTPKIPNLIPPKYTPVIFEEVGRALGASILDVTNSNPVSRVVNSEFRTLQGLRNALKQEIDRNAIKAKTTSKIKIKTKRTLSVTSKTEISKENKGGFHNNIQWENVGISMSSNTPCCSSSVPSRPLSKSSNKTATTIKTNRKASATKGLTFGKIENSNCGAGTSSSVSGGKSKMAMVLCEASTSGVVSGSNTAVSPKTLDIKRNKDQHQIPRKKVKVSPTTQQQQLASKTEDYVGSSANVHHKYSVDLCYKSSIIGASTSYGSSSLPTFFVTKPLTTTTTTTDCKLFSSLDSSVQPCCSYSLDKVSVGENSSSSLAALTGCPSSGSAVNVQPNKVVTIFQKEIKSKFSKSTSSKQAKKFGTGEGSRLKKKRTLKKTDTNLKRKGRAKSLIH